MDIVELDVKAREKSGTSYSRNLRRAGRFPAVLYGHGMDPVSLEVNNREFIHAIHTKAGENAVIKLNVAGLTLKESTCVIKDIQHHPVTEKIQHVDFTVISLTEKIEVEIPVVIKNEADAPGVKAGGVLDVVHHEIQVICLPTAIPESVTVDIKAMEIGDAVHVKELQIPADVEINPDYLEEDEVVVTIHPPRVEEEKEEEEEEAQPEVIEKGKKPAEGEGEGKAEK